MENNYFDILNGLNVNEHTEKKKSGSTELTYLSWSWAVAEVLKRFPDMKYKIMKFQDKNGNLVPYMYDENTGYMCMTEVTIDGITREMWLPVMDGANKAMKKEPYSYFVKEYKWNNTTRRNEPTGKMIEKQVESATMFDINKTIMRCLTKNFAMFGLGLYIFAGEDLPETQETDGEKEPEKTPAEKAKETREQNKIAFETRFDNMYKYFKGNPKWSYDLENRFNSVMNEAIKRKYEEAKCSEMLAIFNSLEKDSIPTDILNKNIKPEEYLMAG